MLDSDWQVVRAELRLKLRKVNAELARIEHEYRHFQRLGFSNDILDITARAHMDQREDILAQLRSIERNDRRSEVGGEAGLLGWLLLPAVLCMIGWRNLARRLA